MRTQILPGCFSVTHRALLALLTAAAITACDKGPASPTTAAAATAASATPAQATPAPQYADVIYATHTFIQKIQGNPGPRHWQSRMENCWWSVLRPTCRR